MNITHHKNGKIKTLVDEAPYHPGYEDAGFEPIPFAGYVKIDEIKNNQILYTACLDCGKKVTGDYIHTCSPQLKTLTDEEIDSIGDEVSNLIDTYAGRREFARAILRKAQEK
jgi:hypothetical protein